MILGWVIEYLSATDGRVFIFILKQFCDVLFLSIYPSSSSQRSIDISFGHGGSGGQMAVALPTLNLTASYLTRHRSLYTAGDDPRWIAVSESLIKCVNRIQESRE